MASLSDLFILNPKNYADDNTLAGFIPMNLVDDGYSGSHSLESKQWGEIRTGYSHFSNGDIGIAKISPCFENRKSVIFNNLPNGIGSGTTELTVLRSIGVYSRFYLLLFKSDWYISQGTKEFKGVVGQQRVNKFIFTDLLVPVPPLEEQERIVSEVEKWFALIALLDESEQSIDFTIKILKSKVLDLAIHGRLVPQDPTDEPASELLKRINPKAMISCDNPHYEQVPTGWCFCSLEDIVDYEQPQAYIVESTDYSELYDIPVLTAGKSFIIGHTHEQEGACRDVPVIIFDDFTTDSKYVDFPFKVKSSAMKILHVKRGINVKYVAYFMSVTRLIGETHKRYWISEYSKVIIPLPPKEEQDRIIDMIELFSSSLDSIAETLA